MSKNVNHRVLKRLFVPHLMTAILFLGVVFYIVATQVKDDFVKEIIFAGVSLTLTFLIDLLFLTLGLFFIFRRNFAGSDFQSFRRDKNEYKCDFYDFVFGKWPNVLSGEPSKVEWTEEDKTKFMANFMPVHKHQILILGVIWVVIVMIVPSVFDPLFFQFVN